GGDEVCGPQLVRATAPGHRLLVGRRVHLPQTLYEAVSPGLQPEVPGFRGVRPAQPELLKSGPPDALAVAARPDRGGRLPGEAGEEPVLLDGRYPRPAASVHRPGRNLSGPGPPGRGLESTGRRGRLPVPPVGAAGPGFVRPGAEAG